MVDPITRGDPMSPLRWTCKSTRQLAKALEEKGIVVSHVYVSEFLSKMGYSLQANRKVNEGGDHLDRDKQFHYINDLCQSYLHKNVPVISVDTKKKENVGNYKNNGETWEQVGQPRWKSMILLMLILVKWYPMEYMIIIFKPVMVSNTSEVWQYSDV